MEHFPQHPQKGVCNEIFTTKETCPPTLNFVYCFTGFIWRGEGWFYMFVSMCFKILSKVVKYTCRLRRYNYTHDQLNTRHYVIIFLGIFLRGRGAKFKFAPGRQILSLRHCTDQHRVWPLAVTFCCKYYTHVSKSFMKTTFSSTASIMVIKVEQSVLISGFCPKK